jgi:hypothetical protein
MPPPFERGSLPRAGEMLGLGGAFHLKWPNPFMCPSDLERFNLCADVSAKFRKFGVLAGVELFCEQARRG